MTQALPAMPLLSLIANDIDAAGKAVDAELPLSWLAEELVEANLTGTAPGHVTARLSRSGKDGIVVRGKVKAELVTPCARCTEDARVSIDTELTLLLTPAKEAHPSHGTRAPHAAHAPHAGAGANGKAKPAAKDDEEYEFTAEEADVDHYDGETVVLDPFVREAILLEVPNFPLCSEDCTGIAAAPSPVSEETGPRIDPRLAPLAALRSKLGNVESQHETKRETTTETSQAPAEPTSKKKNKE